MAKDIFHEHVKIALKKDNWEITNDPFFLRHLKKKLEIDLGAEKIIAAVRAEKKIAIEIKSFLSHSRLYDYHSALGQFVTYRRLLKKTEEDRILYLAVPLDAFNEFFNTPFGKEAIKEEQLKLMVFNPEKKEIVLWID